MTTVFFTTALVSVKESPTATVEKQVEALLSKGYGAALIKAVLLLLLPSDHHLLRADLGTWQEGFCQNCGFDKCPTWCQNDTEYWCHPAREMYRCEKCNEYTCDMEKEQHSKTCLSS